MKNKHKNKQRKKRKRKHIEQTPKKIILKDAEQTKKK
jgi:hypothetical protein